MAVKVINYFGNFKIIAMKSRFSLKMSDLIKNKEEKQTSSKFQAMTRYREGRKRFQYKNKTTMTLEKMRLNERFEQK